LSGINDLVALETEMTIRFAQRLGTLLLALAAGGVSLVPAHATGGNAFLSAQERAIDDLGGWTVDADYQHCNTPTNPKTGSCRALGAPARDSSCFLSFILTYSVMGFIDRHHDAASRACSYTGSA